MQGPPDAPQAGAPQMMQQGLQPSPQAQPGVPIPPQLQAMPAPTQTQVTAALRHFHAIVESLWPVVSDPDLGKTDLKKKIIDGATDLVAQRIVSPAQAVMQLRDVPEKPFDQKQWVMQHYEGAMKGANYVLEHFRMSSPGNGDIMSDLQSGGDYNEDDHVKHMGTLHDHYKGLIRG